MLCVRKMFILFYTLVVTCTCIVNGQIIGSCKTPTGEISECKSIYDCATLLPLVKKKDRTPQDVNQLKRSQCKFSEGIQVCCPKPCYTPDGQQGLCVSIQSCQHLADMLKPPSSKDKMLYVQNSQCIGFNQDSVCCGPPRANPPPVQRECKDTDSALLPDPRSGCCGVDAVNSRIGSNKKILYEYPWLVAIEYKFPQRSWLALNLCSGALISRRYALTNAQCVIPNVITFWTPTNVILGEYDTKNEGQDCIPSNNVKGVGRVCTEGRVSIPIDQTIPHPDYIRDEEKQNTKNDIALIRLEHMAPYTDFIRPICLPTVDVTLATPRDLRLHVAGWGNRVSNVKLQLDLPFVNSEDCQNAYQLKIKNGTTKRWEKQLCAGGEARREVCTSDIGGPLMYKNDGRFEIIGVNSFTAPNCTVKGYPSVFTKVNEYVTWIRSIITP